MFYHVVQFASVFRIDFIKKILGIFKRLFRSREDGSHIWIVTLIGVLCLMQFFSRGPETVFFLFWKMQYGLTLAQYANMTIFLAVRTSIANWVLIPFLSKWLQDTTLIIVSQLTSIIGITVHALGTTFPAFYTSLVLFCFWSFGPTGTRCSFISFNPLSSQGRPCRSLSVQPRSELPSRWSESWANLSTSSQSPFSSSSTKPRLGSFQGRRCCSLALDSYWPSSSWSGYTNIIIIQCSSMLLWTGCILGSRGLGATLPAWLNHSRAWEANLHQKFVLLHQRNSSLRLPQMLLSSFWGTLWPVV